MFTKEEELSRLYLDAKLGNDADIESLIESCDLSSMGEELLSPDNGSNPNLIEWVTQLNRVLSYIDENTELATTVTDDLYDRLIGLQEKLGGNVSIGVYQEVASVEDGTAYHQYPEIRGSLQKVHFIRKEDIPINDSRKSLENYYEQVILLEKTFLVTPTYHVTLNTMAYHMFLNVSTTEYLQYLHDLKWN